MASVTFNFMLKCPFGMERYICSKIIGYKGNNIWAMQREFNDTKLSVQCQLMDAMENITFITCTTENTFSANAFYRRMCDTIEMVIKGSVWHFPDSVVELSYDWEDVRTSLTYVNGVKSSETVAKLTKKFVMAEDDFPSL